MSVPAILAAPFSVKGWASGGRFLEAYRSETLTSLNALHQQWTREGWDVIVRQLYLPEVH